MKESREIKKAILYLAVYDPHVPYTGTGVRGAEFVKYLVRQYSVDLIYMEGSGHPGKPELERQYADRLQGVRRKTRIPFSQKGYFLFSTGFYQDAVKHIRNEKYALIITDYGLCARYGYKLSKKFGIPFIYCSHNIEYRQYMGKAKSDIRRWLLVPYVYSVEKRGCRRCSILVAISEEEAQYYTRWIPREKMIVIPQGFDASIYNPYYTPVQNDPKIVLFFGNYNISTNRDAVRVTLEHIVDPVVQRVPQVKFQFIGANPPLQFQHSHFEFTGFVESMADYIKNADVVISPVLGGWGMPTKVVESLACGKIVIATETGSRSIPRTYSRLLVRDIRDFPDAICRALEEGNPVDGVDFPDLKKDFLWEARLETLKARIDGL
jgi:glycosyltransferase involved in cell wall biosynthesis